MSETALRNTLLALVSVLIGTLLIAVGFLARFAIEPDGGDGGSPAAASAGSGSSQPLDSKLVEDIIKILEEDFVEPSRVNPELLLQGAIQGVFTQLNDPHSTYIDPQTYAISRDDFSGTFQGIGATVAKEENYVVIVRPLAGTPAEKAGLKTGDKVLAVNGEDAEGWSVEKAVLKIRGPRGSTVELKIRHGDGKEETLKIVRDEVLVASVEPAPPGGRLLDGAGREVTDLGYIHIRTFTSRTPKELNDLLQDVLKRGVKGLILDVRGNPGGLLLETAQVTDLFLDKGVILAQVDRNGREQRIEARAGMVSNLPIVVVQDEFSASGSEVLAAALQDNGRATIVGAKSFGKGTVNHVRQLRNGGAVYVSIARWLTPKGQQIEGRGVLPDVEVVLSPEDIEKQRDVALFRAIDVLRSGRTVAAN